MPNKILRLSVTWATILAIASLVIVLQRVRGGPDPEGMTEPVDASVVPLVEPLRLDAELTAKLVVAARAWAPTVSSELLMTNAKPLEEGNSSERLAHAILVGAVEGWSKGADAARAVEVIESDDSDERDAYEANSALKADVVGAMEELATSNGDFAAVSDETRERIEADLGFFGRLLSADGVSEAKSGFAVMIFAGVWYLTVFLLGLVALIALVGFVGTGKWKPALEPTSDGHVTLVLGETFAVWMGLYLFLTIGATLIAAFLPESAASTGGLVLSIAAMGGSLAVLAFPRLRGVSATDLRAAIGLNTGRGILREVGAGVMCYVSAVPILVAGGIIYFILSLIAQAISGEQAPPSHPAVEMLGGAGALEVVLLFTLASVMAPIVEEIAFRGFLYGHLRGFVMPRARLASAMVAAVVSSVIFAAIHPQGLLFVPALGGLAVGFCLYREMRGSLIAPMVAHGINNAFTLALGLMLF
jgi:membrane protease YdiL (CAAX protease family)